MNRILNFSAGPAILPECVLEEASQAVLEFEGSGMSLLEMSHRDKRYDAVHMEALDGVLSALGLSSDEYAVSLVGGGASTQFALVPMNFLRPGDVADYLVGGEWGAKALESARLVGHARCAGTSADTNHDRLPSKLDLAPDARYLHATTNNTIEGTQMHALPGVEGVPLVADMSSDIFGVDRDHSRFDLLYAGAQKNAGPAGVTIVVARKSFLESARTDLPPMLSLAVQAAKQSLYNTPPVFPIFVLSRVLRWIAAEGGVAAVARRNERKAGLVYGAIDAAPNLYEPCVAVPADRSWMNVTFRIKGEGLQTEFLSEAKAAGMDGLPGHRNVGGLRASIYNAFPESGCQDLADLLADFARRKG